MALIKKRTAPDRNYDNQQRLLHLIKDLDMKTRVYMWTRAEYSAALATLRTDPVWEKATAYNKAYIGGYLDALWEERYKHHLHPLWMFDGEMHTADEIDKIIASTPGKSWGQATHCNHYWKNDATRTKNWGDLEDARDPH